MRIRHFASLTCVCLIACSGYARSDTRSPIAEHPDVAAAISLLDAYVESQLAYQGVPGMSLAIVHDQELVWSRGYGLADLERELPATSETIYRIGSVSKLFTSIAILRLCDEGKLRLDDTVDKYLPWFRPRSSFADAPPITIRHLLTHTSGLPANSRSSGWTTFEFPALAQIAEDIQHQGLVGHGGLVGGYRSAVYISPGEKVAVIALSNAVDSKLFPGQSYSIVDKAFEWVAPAIERATKSPPKDLEPDPEWNRYLGTYRAWWADLRVLMMRGNLVLIYSQAEDPGEYPLTLVPDPAGAFHVEGDGFDETGEVVVFESGDSGEIVGMRLADQYFERIE